uniref:P-type conjugative transfer protein TrbL n=1 Tax=Dongia sedimenti TaxID=3064282 RepID=UPI0036D3BFA3
MGDLNVIDRFMATFIRYIDSGFGLLNGDVGRLSAILIGIDITLAGLFWVVDSEANVLARFLKKILYVGVFALILNQFSALADIIYRSFAGLGLAATSNTLTPEDLLKPGRLAGTGFEAAWPLLKQVSEMLGFTSFFDNFLTIIVLLVSWLVVIIAFFILAVQLFITILEFKLTSLAGFVLVPFALWNRTSFLAERVLGNVISTGVKVMVLAVITGIGSTFFGEFITALQGQEPDIGQAMSLVLASLAMLGLGIFGPGIASGLVSGAPQLGAAAAIGTAGAAAGAAMLTGGAVLAGAGALRATGGAGLSAIRAGAALGSATQTAYALGQSTSGATGLGGVAAGLGGVARAGVGAATRAMHPSASHLRDAAAEGINAGRTAAWEATGGSPASSGPGSPPSDTPSATPDWARRLRSEQSARAHRHAATQAIKDGDRPGSPANPDLDVKES